MNEREELAGQTALVTGAASGIGKAAVEALLARGARVLGVDLSPTVNTITTDARYAGLTADVTDEAAVRDAVSAAVSRFGRLDMLVLNAGMFPPAAPIAALELSGWRRAAAVHVEANMLLLREAHPHLRRARPYGRVVVLGSLRVQAPATGTVAYSASKAALAQLARVAALEWAADGIRVNVVHPGRVCDTGVFTPQMLSERAAKYGMTVDQYRRDNLLQVELTSRDVAEAIAELCGPRFANATGVQLHLDGGDLRAI